MKMSCGAIAKWSSIKATSYFTNSAKEARKLDAQDSKVDQYHSCQQLVHHGQGCQSRGIGYQLEGTALLIQEPLDRGGTAPASTDYHAVCFTSTTIL